MTDFLESFLDDYFAECEEHLTTVRRGLLALESSVGQPRPDPAVTEELFRAFHSLKGIAGMVEHREVELLAHEMETYLRAVREGETRLTTQGVDTLIDATRALDEALAARRNGQPAADIAAVVAQLQHVVPGDAGPPSGSGPDGPATSAEQWQCIFTPSAALIARGVNVDAVRGRLRSRGEILSATPIISAAGSVSFRFVFAGPPSDEELEIWQADGMACVKLEQPATPLPSLADAERRGDRQSVVHFVRVDLARLDDLMRMIGDLVIRRARLADAIGRVEEHVPPQQWRAIQENVAALERQLRDLRDGVMRTRLVPVGEIFRRVPFVVRDLARETGKRVVVDISGQATEIDKFLVERMLDPVLHVVRNAVSHGIESVEERMAAGKPPEGTIRLSAAAAGEMVTLQIADDGRGVDADRVVARARVAGLPVPAHVDESVLLDLIASPGFSTRDQSDRVSGRGFGMAVARTTVQELGGSMRLASTPGQGTEFTFELPLTLAIADALIARVGDQMFAVPQSAVREVIEVDPASIQALGAGEMMQYRATPLAVVRLSDVLAIPVAARARLHAFVIGTGAAAVGLIADRIVGQREIVVRSPSDPLIRVPGIAGATDLGDGRAVLILDVAALARAARPAIVRVQESA